MAEFEEKPLAAASMPARPPAAGVKRPATAVAAQGQPAAKRQRTETEVKQQQQPAPKRPTAPAAGAAATAKRPSGPAAKQPAPAAKQPSGSAAAKKPTPASAAGAKKPAPPAAAAKQPSAPSAKKPAPKQGAAKPAPPGAKRPLPQSASPAAKRQRVGESESTTPLPLPITQQQYVTQTLPGLNNARIQQLMPAAEARYSQLLEQQARVGLTAAEAEELRVLHDLVEEDLSQSFGALPFPLPASNVAGQTRAWQTQYRVLQRQAQSRDLDTKEAELKQAPRADVPARRAELDLLRRAFIESPATGCLPPPALVPASNPISRTCGPAPAPSPACAERKTDYEFFVTRQGFPCCRPRSLDDAKCEALQLLPALTREDLLVFLGTAAPEAAGGAFGTTKPTLLKNAQRLIQEQATDYNRLTGFINILNSIIVGRSLRAQQNERRERMQRRLQQIVQVDAKIDVTVTPAPPRRQSYKLKGNIDQISDNFNELRVQILTASPPQLALPPANSMITFRRDLERDIDRWTAQGPQGQRLVIDLAPDFEAA